MAKIFNGIISGRVGDLIFCRRNGVDYVRKVSKRPRKKPSVKQVAQREKFGIVMRFLSPLRGLLDESYRKINPKSSGLQTAAKKILEEAITGEYPAQRLDFSKVSLLRGNLGSPAAEMTYRSETNDLNLWWHVAMRTDCYLDDELIMLIYCPSISQAWTTLYKVAMRYEQGCLIQLPCELLGHEIHIWLAYRSAMGKYSESVYMGQILTKKLQEHENIQ